MTGPIEIRDTEHGVVLSSTDFELIDHLDDFLTEECYVHFDLRNEPERAILFGQASSVEKVEALYERFLAFKASETA